MEIEEEVVIKIENNVIDTTSFPREKWCGIPLFQCNGVWYPKYVLRGVIETQRLFKAEQSDIILATFPKSGTTWIKALAYSIVNRHKYKLQDSPLLTTNPHDFVPFLEFKLLFDRVPDQLTPPRMFATHIPYGELPHSIKDSNCQIVYVCRNPWDNFVSFWHFRSAIKKCDGASIFHGPAMETVEEAFAKYCEGVHSFGPFWKHNLEYWKMSVENPKKVLFIKYEDLKENAISELKRLATFLGFPFTEEEEEQGLVEEISKLCSFGNLRDLDVNKNGMGKLGLPSSLFFRKGEVGDYSNLLTPFMVQTLTNLIQDKFAASGPVFSSK